MKRIPTIALILITFFLFTLPSCTNDELPEPGAANCATAVVYTGEIEAIISNSCAYEGCHVAGFSSGDYTTYENLKPFTDSGSFTNRVITQREDPNSGMPPNNAPAGRPQDLTEVELDLIRCWIEGGFLEN